MRSFVGLVAVCGVFVSFAMPASGAAATVPTVQGFHFTTNPYPANICGIDVTGVDIVSGNFVLFASGASISGGGVTTIFTNPASGNSIRFRYAGLSTESAPIDNGNGSFSIVVTDNGLSPKISTLNGPPLEGINAGSVSFEFLFDSATGDLLAFGVLRAGGPRPGVDCNPIVAALT